MKNKLRAIKNDMLVKQSIKLIYFIFLIRTHKKEKSSQIKNNSPISILHASQRGSNLNVNVKSVQFIKNHQKMR